MRADDGETHVEDPAPVRATTATGTSTPAHPGKVDHPGGGRRKSGPAPPRLSPSALPLDAAAAIPESFRYRLKNRLLGPPLTSERLSTERLGRPTALAVLSSDVISSSAYATEQALIPLIQVVGLAAFSLLVPVSIAVIVVLAFVTLSYLEVVKVYTKAGGAYVVARENFGLKVAQVAAVSLLIDYTLTVAVSVAAGVAALTSVFPALKPATTLLAVVLVVLISFGNLRGVREAGKTFAVPTYFFIANMVVLLSVGTVRALTGALHAHSIHQPGAVPIGSPGTGLLYGASLFVLLRSFASGGSALTGTEAISNGVSVFRQPESRNARITMVWMALILGSLVLGVSALASVTHPVPYVGGTPTVLSQVAKFVYGTAPLGRLLYVLLQASTMFILVLAANTSFTGFPYLASFAAEDSYLPRQLTRRGHRLVFSSGILVLTVVSIVLLVITRAQVDKLIPLYAIGVFTGFTMAGAGMFRLHLRRREPHWRRAAVINGSAAVLSFLVDIVIVVTKFTEGAWTIVIILPLGVLALLRLHREYADEEVMLEVGAARATEAPILRRHVVVVLVDRLDMATARAIQYARTLAPDDLRAVHFDIDSQASSELEAEWRRLGLARLPLDIIECPDRRLGRATVELVADAVVDGDTECTVLLPRRSFASGWQRLLHDRTADKIAAVVSQVPHVSATIVPFRVSTRRAERVRSYRSVLERAGVTGDGPGDVAEPVAKGPPSKGGRRRAVAPAGPGVPGDGEERGSRAGRREHARWSPADQALARRSAGTRPISDAAWRERVRVAGRVKSVRVQPRAGTSNLECVLADGTGKILLVFQGRPRIPGVEPGARLVAEGMVGAWSRQLAILNPDYELVGGGDTGEPPASR
ncbi:MAG TPA: amino acid permease [Acidimicrobiales bacterium]|nr:amino acid permease [Acidimicrobiales bacterium]